MKGANNKNALSEAHLEPIRCASCNDVVRIEPGDVVYEGKWYHKDCWDSEEDRQILTQTGVIG